MFCAANVLPKIAWKACVCIPRTIFQNHVLARCPANWKVTARWLSRTLYKLQDSMPYEDVWRRFLHLNKYLRTWRLTQPTPLTRALLVDGPQRRNLQEWRCIEGIWMLDEHLDQMAYSRTLWLSWIDERWSSTCSEWTNMQHTFTKTAPVFDGFQGTTGTSIETQCRFWRGGVAGSAAKAVAARRGKEAIATYRDPQRR